MDFREHDIETIIEALSEGYPDERLDAAQELELREDPRALNALVEALSDEDEIVRGAVLAALKSLADKRAIETILQVMKDDPIPRLRAEAAEILAGFGMIEALEPAIRLLFEPDSFTRYSAIVALAELRDPQAIEPLISALTDTTAAQRPNAAWALQFFDDPRVIRVLLAALSDPNENVRDMAALSVGVLKVREAVDTLIANLDSPDRETVRCSAIALGRIGDTRAVSPLKQLLQRTNDSWLKRDVAGALAEINDSSANEYLLTALESREQDVLLGACKFFISKGVPGSEAVLAQALSESTEWYGVWGATEAFLRSGNPVLERAAEKKLEGKVIKGEENEEYPAWGSDANSDA